MSEQVSETMFRIDYSGTIERVEVVRRTKCFVTIACTDFRGRRYEVREGASRFFGSWEEAHQSQITKVENEIKWAEDKLHRLRSRLGQLKSERAPQ